MWKDPLTLARARVGYGFVGEWLSGLIFGRLGGLTIEGQDSDLVLKRFLGHLPLAAFGTGYG